LARLEPPPGQADNEKQGNSVLATLAEFERAPRILRLNKAGQPVEWLAWQDAVCLYARELVLFTLGEAVLEIRGGHSRFDGSRSKLDIHSIIACEGRVVAPLRQVPPLTNQALFRRDRNLCLYCGDEHLDRELTRDHVVPRSRGGSDQWDNCVAACRRCNHRKGDRLPHERRMELLALPYVPNFAEYLALTNSGRILGDQMDFLKAQFGADSRLLH
jgi:HNH endonuclease